MFSCSSQIISGMQTNGTGADFFEDGVEFSPEASIFSTQGALSELANCGYYNPLGGLSNVGYEFPPGAMLGTPFDDASAYSPRAQDEGVRFVLENSKPTSTTEEFIRRHSLPDLRLHSERSSDVQKKSRKNSNRTAAFRCRARKASWVKETQDKLDRDRVSNNALLKNIHDLQEEIFTIHLILSTASKQCPSTYRICNRLPPDQNM